MIQYFAPIAQRASILNLGKMYNKLIKCKLNHL